MPIRHREYTLEVLEQRMLLSGDGFAPLVPPTETLPSWTPVDVVIFTDTVAEEQNQTPADAGALVDTSPVVTETVTVAENDASVTQTTVENTVTLTTSVTPATPTAVTPQADPLVSTAADFSVMTLTSGNGPPSAGNNDHLSISEKADALSAWDPPLGGFNFTATDPITGVADYAALNGLLDGTTDDPVTLLGSIVNRASAGWAAGTLALEGMLTFARHMDGAEQAEDADGHAIFSITFTSLDGELSVGGVVFNLDVGAGAFLVSGDLATPDTTGGMAGTASINSITVAGLAITNTVTFDLTDVDLNFNTTGADAVATNVGGAGIGFSFTGPSQHQFLRVGGTLSMTIGTSAVSVTLGGNFGFEVATVAGSETIAFALSGGSAALTVGGVTLTASGLAGAFLIKSTGVAGWASVGGITATGVPGGFSFGELSNVSVNLNTTGADATATNIPVGSGTTSFSYTGSAQHDFFRVTGTVALNVNHGGLSTKIKGTITFDRSVDTSDNEVILRVAVVGGSSEFAAGSAKLAITGINGGFVLKNNGFAGRASVGGLTLTGVTGFTFTITNLFFEINTTGGAINDVIATGGDPIILDFVAPDRHSFIAMSGDLVVGLEVGSFNVSLDGSFAFEQATLDPGTPEEADVIKFGMSSVDFSVAVGTVELNILNANGAFVIYQDGFAGKLDVGQITLTGITGFTFDVQDFSFAMNTTNRAINEVISVGTGMTATLDYTAADRHNFVALSGHLIVGLEVGAFNVSLDGNFAFERATLDPGTPEEADVIKFGMSSVDFSVAVGASVSLNILNANGAFVIYEDGFAGELDVGQITLTGITGFTFDVQDFRFAMNTTNRAVSEVISVGTGMTATLDYTAADRHNFVALSGHLIVGLEVGSFNVSLDGSFAFEQATLNPGTPEEAEVIKFGMSSVDFSVAVGASVSLNILNANGAFVIYEDGFAGELDVGQITLTGITGFTFDVQDFSFAMNTTNRAINEVISVGTGMTATLDYTAADRHNFVALSGHLIVGLEVGSFNVSLDGSFAFEQATLNPGTPEEADVIKFGMSSVDFSVGVGSLSLNILNANGAFVFYEDGFAGKLDVGQITLTGITGFTFDVQDFSFAMNTTNRAINEVISVGTGMTATLDYTAADRHDFIALGGRLILTLEIGSFAGEIDANFYFEKATLGSTDVIKVSVSDGSFTLGIGGITLDIQAVNGAFVMLEGGSAGHLSIGSMDLTGISGFSIGVDDFFLEFNDTGGDVVMNVPVNGGGPDVELNFTGPSRHDFIRLGGSIVVKIGGTPASPFVTLTALDVVVDTGATGSDHVFEAAVLSGSISIGSLGTITVTAGNLAVTAEGKLTNLDPDSLFFVSVSFGGPGDPAAPNADSFQWPAWLPIQIKKIALYWDDVENAPTDFILVLSASIGPFPGLTTLNFSGMVENLRLDVGKLTDGSGDFPILGFDAAAVQISGNLFGLQVSGGIVMGMIDFRADGEIIDRDLFPTEVAHGTIFYFGLNASVNIAGIGGAGFRIGMADIDPGPGIEIVPLQAYISVAAPVIIEPISGLTLGAFTAGIEFASTLEDEHYEDIDNLKAVTIANSLNPSLDVWEDNLRTSTLAIYNGNASGDGNSSVWDQPMVITAAVTLYSSYVSPQALNGTVMVKLDTEGRILLIGELLFGGGSLKLDAKMYADLTQVESANFSFSFYASYGPTMGPKVFEIAASLKVMILKTDGTTWDVDTDAADDKATLKLELEGEVRFVAGGAMIVKVQGTVDLEVDLVGTGVRLGFNAQVGIVEPTPNPLGPNFGELAGYVAIFEDAEGFQMYGAVEVIFKPDSLKDYGLDVNATVFLQINTTSDEQKVTLEYFDGDEVDVFIRPDSFSLYVQGDLSIGAPGSEPADAFLTMNGFVIIEIDENGLTLVFDVDLELAPGGTRLLTLDATGFMRINGDGIAARLDLTLAADFPPSTGLEIDADFLLIINTTGEIVSYDVPEFITGEAGYDGPTQITIAQAAPALAPLATGDFSVAADGINAPGEDYFIVAASGNLTALSFTLSGDFFIIITPGGVQLQVNAELALDPLGTLEVHGFLDISADGAAGLLDVELELTALQSFGIEVDGQFMLAFNTYATPYDIPDAVADQFGMEHGSQLPAGLIRLAIVGNVTVSEVLELHGRFFFEKTAEQTTLEVDATMSMPILGTLNVDGDLILSDAGAVGSLVVTLQSSQGLADIGITFTATILLKVNTTGDPADDPGETDPAIMIAADTVILDMSGSVTLLDTFSFNGHFYFRKSGSDLEIRFDATLDIEVGTFEVTGEFISTAAGFQAKLTLEMATSPALASVGFKISGSFLLAINSTNSVMTLSDLPVALAEFTGTTVQAHGLKIVVKGQLELLDGFLKFDGRFVLTQGTGYLEIEIDASINLAGLVNLSVDGFAGIYEDNPATAGVNEGGIVLSFDLHASFSLAGVFTAEGDFAFRLNTTGVAKNGIGAGDFRIAVTNLELSFLGLITVTGGLDITYTNGTGVLKISFHASADFFGIGTVSLLGSADSSGKFDVTFLGTITIGIEGFFGIKGTVNMRIKGQGEGLELIEGSIGGTAWLVGIGFGVNVGISWDGGENGTGRLRASVAIKLNFFLFSITIRGSFDLGYIKSTITWQAGTANDTRVGNGEDFPGGELWINVGDRAVTNPNNVSTTGRNYSEDEIDEQVFISQVAPGIIEVELFGKKKQYNGVTSVHVNTGNGNDYVFVDSSVTVPVYIDLGSGDDMADIETGGSNNNITIWGGTGNDTINGGSGIETIYGGEGDDYLTGGGGNDVIYGGNGNDVIEGGSGADTLYGEAGDDSFIWSSGHGQDLVISGGAGANSLSIIGNDNANTLNVTASGSNFNAVVDGATLSPTAVSALFASLNGGADIVTLGLLDTTILNTVNLSLGYNDGAADQVTITGSSSADYYHLTSSSTTADRPISTSYADPENPVTTYATVTTTQVRIAKTADGEASSTGLIDYYIDEGGYANDRVIIEAGDGHDYIDGSNVVNQAVKLTLNGGNGNDTLTGSNFADTINSGAGDDVVTGGPGVDIFSDTGGADTLIEQMDRNFTLNGWTLVSGSESESLASAAFETIRLTGGATANTFTITNLLATTLWLDGGEHNDVFTINVRGSGISTINISDTGVGVPNTETLTINGTSGDDLFLVRDGVVTVGTAASPHYETINYAGMNQFYMHGGAGRDSFTIDEIRHAGAIYGDEGDDTFTVGRIIVAEGLPAPAGISTIDTTRGWLTYGNFAVFDIYGGEGDDTFEINHNQAELRLFGENGDDLFWIKTYLEEGSALSTVSGGSGSNVIRYVQNGPLKIDGGAGFDRIILEGTEADDVFVITDTQIFGAGRQIDFVNIEGIVILGAGGDDTFWILGNGLPLEIQGGTGNDTVYIGGQAPDYVYDAPAYIVDPPAYIDHYDPVWTTPPPIIINVAAHWAPVRWAGITWWWNWVNAFQIVIPRAPYISSWTPVWVDPPAYTVDPTPITYRFKEVTQFDGVLDGVEVYEWATATSGPGATPTDTTDLGTIEAPVKFVGGDDPGILTENDRLIVNLGTSTDNLVATMQTVDEIITDFDLETKTESFVNKGPIGQLLGLGLPNSLTLGGRTFMGGLTFLGVESAQFTFGTGNDTFTLDGSFGGVNVTVNGNGGADTFNVRANSGNLVLNGGAGNDTFNLDSTAPNSTPGTLNGITGPVTLNGGADADILYLDDRLDALANSLLLTSSTITGLGLTAGVGYSGFESIAFELGSGADTVNLRSFGIAVTLNSGGGNDTVFVGSNAGQGNTNGTLATIAAPLTVDGGTGGAAVIFDDTGDGTANSGTLTPATLTGLGLGGLFTYSNLSVLTMNLGGAGNTFVIVGTHVGVTNLSSGNGNDEIAIRMISGATNVTTGGGSDIVRVGSLAPVATGGTLNGITGLLTLDGGASFNQLILDDTGDTVDNTGAMTSTTITGLGMSAGINYTNFATLLIGLGSGNDTFTIHSTAATTAVTVNGNNGNDTFNIRTNAGLLAINGNNGNDLFQFGSNAPVMSGGNLDGLQGAITINGGNDTDSLGLDDRGDTSDNVATITTTTIAGLDMGAAGITYAGFESLLLGFGSGADTANIRSINIATTLELNGGNDSIWVSSVAGLATSGGDVHGINATLDLNGGTGGATLFVDDTGDGSANTGTLTATTLTGLGLGATITYASLTVIDIRLGAGGNTFTVSSTHAATTILDSGAGSDTILLHTVAGATNVQTRNGDDIVRVGSLAPGSGGTVNGISALLSLDGGAGVNQLFVDDTGDALANTGVLTNSTLTGLGMSSGISYANFADLEISLGSGDDNFTIAGTHANHTTLKGGPGADVVLIASIAGQTWVLGEAGDDTVSVNPAHVIASNPIGAELTLDGNEGGDLFIIRLSGQGHSVVNVHDTGIAGVDNLIIYETPADDTVLFRREFVALLQYDGDGVQLPTFERINYNSQIDGALTVTSVGGANYFALDDNSSVTVINGADEGDIFQIGQIFGNDFIGAGIDHGLMIETTRGWLSPGISHKLVLNGGDGDDLFSVYHNRAVLDLNGGDGDDTFVIRAFALADSVNGEEVFDALRGSTNVSAGGGVNHIAYALNAPVTIDGGGGFNSVVVIATEFEDTIVVTQNGVYGAGLFVEFINIQQLVINAAEGNDHIWILGTPAETAVRVVAGLGSDTVYLGGDPGPVEIAVVDGDGEIIGTTTHTFPPSWSLSNIQGPLFIEGGLGNGVPNLEPGVGLPGEVTGPLPDMGNVNFTVNENFQVDRVVINNTGATGGGLGVLTSERFTGFGLTGDKVIAGVAFSAGLRYLEFEEVIVQLGSGGDTLTIEGTHKGRTIVHGNDGSDTINVRSVSGHTTIYGGSGDDVINVGSLAPATGGNLDGIDALLALDGGAGLDTVNVDQRGNTVGSTGWLTQTTLTGLEMTSVLAVVNDTISFRVNATSGTYTLAYGAATPEVLAWNATADDLTAALWRLLGNRNAFAQQLGDEFIINFQGSLRTQAVNLNVTGDVTVTHRTAGVNYYGIDTLNLDLGSGADVLNIRGTTAVTNVNSHDGEDRFYVSSLADLTTSTFTDLLTGHLDDITGTLNIDAGTGRNLLMVSDEASSAANGTLVTPALVTSSLLRGFAPADINYLADAAAGSFAQGITLWTGAGADIISVTSTDHRADVRTTTTVNSGAGDDHVTVALSVASDGFFVLNTQDGDDTVDASASTLPVIVFGGSGADTLTGGTSGDILFGDHGRIQYLDGATVVAQIGGGGPGDFTDGLFRDDYILFTADAALGAGDIINGLTGDDVLLGGAAGDTIHGGEGNNIVLGDHGMVTVAAGIVTNATTTVAVSGGADTITTLAGRDFILGGEAGDLVDAGAGDDAIAGDHGTFAIASPTAFTFTAAEFANGGADTLTGGAGADLIVGGADNDLLLGNDGGNVVLGDHGTVVWESSTGSITVTSSAESVGGADTIVTGIDADVILGGAGADDITSGAGADVVFGDAGTATLSVGLPVSVATTAPGSGAGDLIQTNDGADTVLGGDGDDTIDGGDGANLVFGDHGTVVWESSTGSITVTSSAESVGGADTIVTGIDADVILGGAGADDITSGAGDDLVFGDAGTVILSGGLPVSAATTAPGSGAGDLIQTNDGADTVLGGDGDDTIDAGNGANLVFGDYGVVTWNGTLVTVATALDQGVGGGDTIATGADDDFIFGGNAGDIIHAGAGADVIIGDQGAIIFTDGLALLITNSPATDDGDDQIFGEAGSDVILGGGGADTIDAATGDNTIVGDHAEVVRAVNGSAIVTVTVTSLSLGSGGNDIIAALDGINFIVAGAGDDTVDVGEGLNAILGDEGVLDTTGFVLSSLETFVLFGGNDTLRAASGTHYMAGGLGADILQVAGGVSILLGDHGRIDVNVAALVTATTFDATTGGNDTIVAGDGTHWIFGGGGGDAITVGNGIFVIFGDHGLVELTDAGILTVLSIDEAFGGSDTIAAGAGDDLILGGAGADTINAGEGNNLVFGDNGFVHVTDGVVDHAMTMDDAGAGGPDNITTGSGMDIVFGGANNDTVRAGGGVDVVFGDSGEVLFVAGKPVVIESFFSEQAGHDELHGEADEDIILGGQGSDTVHGGLDNDIIIGDEGAVVLSAGVVQSFASDPNANGVGDMLNGDEGDDLILGGNGGDVIHGGEGNNVIVGDNALFAMPDRVFVQVEILSPQTGGADVVTAGAGDDVIMGGTAGDTLSGGAGNNVVVGDHATITFAGGVFATLVAIAPELGGDDVITTGSGHDLVAGGAGADRIDAGDGYNVVFGDHAQIVLTGGSLTLAESVAFADGGADVIFTGSDNDFIVGGAGGDTIDAGAGNDLVFGDHAMISGAIDLALLPLAMADKPFVFAAIATQNLGADGRPQGGDDVVFAGAGDDIVFGQQGDDILFGEDGNDDLVGGHNVGLGQDGSDVLDGGAGFDVLAGDNAAILRTGDNLSLRARVLTGIAVFDDRGNLLVLDTAQAWPTDRPERAIVLLDHAFDTAPGLFGADLMVGGAGDDVLFGQLGDDKLHGDAVLTVAIAADGTVDRAAVRAAASALFAGAFWQGADTDGDDYIEGNGGDDVIFGGLGQDDLIGGSSLLFGLTESSQRPDGSDVIYGGNGTAAADASPGDDSDAGRARDADVIMGDNANVIRLVGINGINSGAFMTFSYAPGAAEIIVRGFQLLDYTTPASPLDIGAADTIYGEDGDDTLHGQVGDDAVYGNGNDDNVYGGQGDDLLFGGAGDDGISGSDELKPPAPPSKGAAEAGIDDDEFIQTLASNLPVLLFVPRSGPSEAIYFADLFLGYDDNAPLGGNPGAVFADGGSAWRIFTSGVFPSSRFGVPAMTFDLQMGLGDFEPAGAEGEPTPEQPAEEEQPETAPAEGETPPAEEEAAPAGDEAPATPPAEEEEPSEASDNEVPPATPPAPENGLPPAPPEGA